ncbi:DNA translocase FtsK [Halobacillus naozhouensis]|uniref:DNA translocase FtsK n=1 Tax=Halobacillus naozhouensis TaxID=554880 RepID=A0ABY8IUQ2_9BACI|nr:DNA translocase FtsK [Halobacillus naozhouensis]WFT73522.1 DNA translocase FtsK [Halobacillus naozhouensis]
MWNEFKNKFKGLFDSDEDQTQRRKPHESKRNHHESNANTKMTYKYPKAGNFRFPVIPDTSKQNNHEKPAYKTRSKKREQEKKREFNYDGFTKEGKKSKEDTYRKSAEKSKQSKPKLPETSSQPFTPSDVPSPIYGYNPRAKPVVNEEEPEYKKQNPNNFSQSLSMEQARSDEEQWQAIRQRMRGKIDEGKKREKRPVSLNRQAEKPAEKSDLSVKEPRQDVVDNEIKEFPIGEKEQLNNTLEKAEDIPSEEESTINTGAETAANSSEQTIANTKEKTVTKEENQSGSSKEKSESLPEPKPTKPAGRSKGSRVPFNVVMTPRDKRSRDQQKKTLLKDNDEEPVSVKASDQVEEHDPEADERLEYSTPLHLLNDPVKKSSDDQTWIHEQMELLETTLRQFHVKAKVVHAMKGPAVTRFEVQPEPGVKVSKITNLSDDIKLSMAARDIRIEAPIPGKQAVGIEVPNQQAEMVGLQKIFESEAFRDDSSPLSVALGLDIGGDSVVTNLKKMPHGLIAGATGSGKSVCINTILISLLYKAHHEDVKFLLIDPKMVELAPYNNLPHLVSPVITDVKAATTALKWAVKEMEERYEKFVAEGARDVERYNEKMIQQGRKSEKLPYLVIVIDELADLMMVSPQDVEDSICRIAQKARACGIHLLVATQRPSVDVITGLIKANIPTRIAFSVSSQVDSRTIIDTGGAEKLLGKGDMLFIENGSGRSVRIQGAFVSDDEIERITGYVKKIAPPNYLFEQEELIKQLSNEEATDALFEEAVHFVLDHNGASASLLQRRFKVGYNRAARLIDQMEDYGIISEQKGSKPRDILLTKQQVDELMGTMA